MRKEEESECRGVSEINRSTSVWADRHAGENKSIDESS